VKGMRTYRNTCVLTRVAARRHSLLVLMSGGSTGVRQSGEGRKIRSYLPLLSVTTQNSHVKTEARPRKHARYHLETTT
jgi:hypothetical protein